MKKKKIRGYIYTLKYQIFYFLSQGWGLWYMPTNFEEFVLWDLQFLRGDLKFKSCDFFMWEYGNPLQYSCLENPRDGRAWWAAVYGVAQSRTRLKWLSSSSSSSVSMTGSSSFSYWGAENHYENIEGTIRVRKLYFKSFFWVLKKKKKKKHINLPVV